MMRWMCGPSCCPASLAMEANLRSMFVGGCRGQWWVLVGGEEGLACQQTASAE